MTPSREADEAFKDLALKFDRVEVRSLMDNEWTVVLWKLHGRSLEIDRTAKIHNETGRITWK